MDAIGPAVTVAAFKGDSDMLEVLCSIEGVNVDTQRSWDGKTALHIASEQGNEECVKVLLAAGASVEIEDSNRRNALINAIHGCQSLVVDILLKQLLREKSEADTNQWVEDARREAAFRHFCLTTACHPLVQESLNVMQMLSSC